MQFKGVSFKDMTHEQLEAAESYTADAISQHMAHLEFLRVAYQEIWRGVHPPGKPGRRQEAELMHAMSERFDRSPKIHRLAEKAPREYVDVAAPEPNPTLDAMADSLLRHAFDDQSLHQDRRA